MPVVCQYRALKQALEQAFPGQLEIGGAAGRSSSFEISVGAEGKQLFSKLQSGSFPEAEGVKAAVAQFIKDGTVSKLALSRSCSCISRSSHTHSLDSHARLCSFALLGAADFGRTGRRLHGAVSSCTLRFLTTAA